MDFIKQRLRQDDGQTSEPRGRSPISLEDHLPQPVDDHTIAEKVKTLKDFVETHVHQFYRAADEADDYASDDDNPPQSPEDASSMSGSQHELFQTAYDRTDHAPSRYHDYQRGPSDHTPSSHQYPEYQQPRVVSNHQARFSNDQFQQPTVDYSYPQAQPDYTRPTSDYTYHQSDYSSRPTIVDRGASRQAPSHQSRRGSAGDRLSRSWRKEVHRIVSKTLIERINPYGDEPETFLPREIVQFLRALPQGENTDVFNVAISEWRIRSVYLLGLHRAKVHNKPYMEERERSIQRAIDYLRASLRDYADPQQDDERLKHLKSLMVSAADLGLLLLRQPARYEFSWTVPDESSSRESRHQSGGSGSAQASSERASERGRRKKTGTFRQVNFPALLKVTDNTGRRIARPHQVTSAESARLRISRKNTAEMAPPEPQSQSYRLQQVPQHQQSWRDDASGLSNYSYK